MTEQDPTSPHPGGAPPSKETAATSTSLGQSSLPLTTTAFVLFGAYGISVVGGIVPVSLLNPAWQLRLAGLLIGTGFLPLLGLCLLHMWKVLPDGSGQPRRRLLDLYNRLRRLSVLVVIGFLLLLPLQTSAAWQLIQSGFRGMGGSGPASAQARLDAMEKAIREAPDAKAIQSSLTILRGPGIAPQDLQRPLPQLKQLLLESLGRARQNLTNDSRQESSQRVWILIQECLRNSLLALAYAAGFAAFAQRPHSPRSVLEEILDRTRRSEADRERQRVQTSQRREQERERQRLRAIERQGRDRDKRRIKELQRQEREQEKRRNQALRQRESGRGNRRP